MRAIAFHAYKSPLLPLSTNMKIKRINRGGKYYTAVISDRGKVTSLTKWSQKKPLSESVSKFKSSGSVREGERINTAPGWKFKEIIRQGKRKPGRNVKYQAYVEIKVDGKTFYGRSNKTTAPFRIARLEAIENAAGQAYDEYDAELVGDEQILSEGSVIYARA